MSRVAKQTYTSPIYQGPSHCGPIGHRTHIQRNQADAQDAGRRNQTHFISAKAED